MDLKGVGISQFWNVKAFVQSAADGRSVAFQMPKTEY